MHSTRALITILRRLRRRKTNSSSSSTCPRSAKLHPPLIDAADRAGSLLLTLSFAMALTLERNSSFMAESFFELPVFFCADATSLSDATCCSDGASGSASSAALHVLWAESTKFSSQDQFSGSVNVFWQRTHL